MISHGFDARIATGVTRFVILIGPCAFKLPQLKYGWRMFLRGLLSNMTEAEFAPLADELALSPTVFSIWGGFLNVQRRCVPLTDEQWRPMSRLKKWRGLDCDYKRDNFGMLDGRVVLLDFGERLW